MEAIRGFFGEYRFLSNFGPGTAWYAGVEYPSGEHAFQAAKFDDLAYRDLIRRAKTAREAKRLGRTRELPVRDGWDDGLAFMAMSEVVATKFAVPQMGDLLLATGDAYLEETNDWGDRRWGVTGGEGLNLLGQILMATRASLRAAASEPRRSPSVTPGWLRAGGRASSRAWSARTC